MINKFLNFLFFLLLIRILQNNQIKSIDKDSFIDNVSLELIDIKESSIDNLDYNAFNSLINLKKL